MKSIANFRLKPQGDYTERVCQTKKVNSRGHIPELLVGQRCQK